MSLVLKCDICGKLIEPHGICKRVESISVLTDESDTGVPIDSVVDDMDICSGCWDMLIDGIKAKLERKRQSKENDMIFSDPWDPGVMVHKRRD